MGIIEISLKDVTLRLVVDSIRMDKDASQTIGRVIEAFGLTQGALSSANEQEQTGVGTGNSSAEATLEPASTEDSEASSPGVNGQLAQDGAELAEYLSSDVRWRSAVVNRFLSILSWAHQRADENFRVVLNISGTRRKYFAKSAEELDASGTKVSPKRIPDSDYWVITTTDTPTKEKILRQVLQRLGYSDSVIDHATEALKPGRRDNTFPAPQSASTPNTYRTTAKSRVKMRANEIEEFG